MYDFSGMQGSIIPACKQLKLHKIWNKILLIRGYKNNCMWRFTADIIVYTYTHTVPNIKFWDNVYFDQFRVDLSITEMLIEI